MDNTLQHITIGRYFPHDSVIHKMQPRLKFIILISLMIAVGITSTNYSMLIMIFISIVLGVLSRIPFKVLIRGLKPFLFLLLFTFLFHLFLSPGRPIPLFFLRTVGITFEGLQQGIIIDLRLIILIYLSSILTLTTSPQKIVGAIEWFLKPLKLFGFPVRNFTMIILISLKFIPILLEEISKTVRLHRTKSSKDVKWNLRGKIKEALALLSPIVINSFLRADELAKKIDTHGFDVVKKH